MQTISKKTEVLIVGAGMAGLCAATDLQSKGHDVLVIDKGRGLGGRMANRRIGEATFDHGAQFITARNEHFQALINSCIEAGAAREWYRTKAGEVSTDATAHPRWCGQPSITAIAKSLATSLDVQKQARLSSIQQVNEHWIATLESGEVIQANAMIMTPPVPQILELLNNSKVTLPERIKKQLYAISYERCIAVMAVLDTSIEIEEPGTLAPDHKDIALIIDNQVKGISKLPAVTIHGTPEFSLEHWDSERSVVGKRLLDSTQAYLKNAQVVEYQTHGWLYSRPHKVEEASHAVISETPPLLVAGDAFGAKLTGKYVEARVEGAALSGWAAAGVLAEMI